MKSKKTHSTQTRRSGSGEQTFIGFFGSWTDLDHFKEVLTIFIASPAKKQTGERLLSFLEHLATDKRIVKVDLKQLLDYLDRQHV